MVVKELVALLGIKTDKKSHQQAEGGMQRLIGLAKAAAVAFAGLKIVQWLKGTVQEVANLGDRFDKLAKRTGLEIQKLQELEHAAELSGASLGDVETGIRRLQGAQVEAADGTAEYKDEFKRLGVEVKNADGSLKDTTELLIEIADGMQGLETDAERTQVAMKLLGRGGVKLIPMLKGGSDALREMMGEMEALGAVMDEELVQASADYVDNQRRIDVAVRGVKNAIGKALLPQINAMTSGFIEWWKINGKIIRQHLEQFFKKLGFFVAKNVKFFGSLLDGLFRIVKGLTPLQKKILGVAGAIMGLGLLLKAGPIGKLLMLLGILGLVIEDFQTWKEGGESAIQTLLDKFEELTGIPMPDTFDEWWEDIKAFADGSGDILDGLFSGLAVELEEAGVMFESWLRGDEKALQESVARQRKMWDEYLPQIADGMDKLFGVDFPRSTAEGYQAVVDLFNNVRNSSYVWFDDILIGWRNMFTKMADGALKFGLAVRLTLLEWKQAVIDWTNDIVGQITAPFRKAWEYLQKLRGEGGGKPPAKPPSAVGAGASKILTAGAAPRPGGVLGAATAAVSGGNSTVINSPRTNIQVDVSASPGMDEKKLAHEVGRQVGAAIEKQNRDAMRSLTPLPAGPV